VPPVRRLHTEGSPDAHQDPFEAHLRERRVLPCPVPRADHGDRIRRGARHKQGIKNSTILSEDIKGKAGTASAKAVNGTITTHDIAGQAANAGNGTPYINGTITQWDVKDESLVGADIVNGSVTGGDLQDGSVGGADVTDNSITSDDVAPLNGDADIVDNTITTFDLADNSVDSDEVLDFGLSNQDIGVLYAQVNGDATLATSSGGVTVLSLGTGTYEVDFGRNVSACAFVATQGEAGNGGANGAIMGVTDRSGNVEGVFVSVRDAAGVLVDRAFQIIVVC
jgi:hypothetical protein